MPRHINESLQQFRRRQSFYRFKIIRIPACHPKFSVGAQALIHQQQYNFLEGRRPRRPHSF